jgi:hypothetical protein
MEDGRWIEREINVIAEFILRILWRELKFANTGYLLFTQGGFL